jgi:hypothetical protein
MCSSNSLSFFRGVEISVPKEVENLFPNRILGTILYTRSQSQWPRLLRHEPSSSARTLGSWVRILLQTWMPVSLYSVCVCVCVCVLFCL